MQVKLHILVIDDDEAARNSLSTYLQLLGYQTSVACNGREGVELFFRQPVDLVLTDLIMPQLDGFGVVQRLAAEFPRLPLIVISGVADLNEAIKALRLGAWDYLTKPIVNFEVINITIRRVLERARLMEENLSYRTALEQQVLERTRQLGESEERYRQLFLQHEDAIVLCRTGHFTVVELNPAAGELFGYQRHELAGQSVAKLFPAPVWQELAVRLAALQGKEPLAWKHLEALTTDGAPLIISCKGWLVSLEGEALLYLSMRDMGEKVRLEEEMRAFHGHLIQANKMASLGMLVSGMAHEINNPNNFIAVNAGLLEEIWRDAAPLLLLQEEDGMRLGGLTQGDAVATAGELIAGISRGSQRIAAVVSGLRDFSRSSLEKQQELVDLCRVVSDARMILDHHIQARCDHFTLSCEDGLPLVRGSHQQLEQVVINLLQNALQALPDRQAAVSVQLSVVGRELSLVVSDCGCGMGREVLERLTEPFFSTRLSEGGTGLGLSISASIVREHGGIIRFESEPGKGTRVVVTLPVAEGEEIDV